MLTVTIDNVQYKFEEALTIIQACEVAGKEIPRFCYHEKLKIAGNCRMCLVEVDKAPKPVASCAMEIADQMVIHTNTPKVKKAREGVMEFLLINHPLDCPICDQGGECDLQDQAFKYGSGKSRFTENKRAVLDKDMGPLIKTHMTRCIHCTRCVRFAEDIAGIPEIGTLGRGEDMEITTYLNHALKSELSGNLSDLCPVGALTSKPYEFKARNWELKHTESIDVLDAVGSNIRIDSRGGLEVMRILPKINEDINEEWLGDKSRFAYDGLKYQRLDRPYIKRDGKFHPVSWSEVINTVAKKLSTSSEMAVIAGTLIDCETLFVAKEFFSELGCKNFSANQFNYKLDTSSRSNYLFNTTIAKIEEADLCLLVGANPRYVSPAINIRIGKMVRQNLMRTYRIGEKDDQTYPITELGNSTKILQDIDQGSHPLCKELSKAKKPIIIIGDGVLTRTDSLAILSLLQNIAKKYFIIREDWNGFNILHNHASMVGSLDLGFYSSKDCSITSILNKIKSKKIGLVYLLGADEIDHALLEDVFVIYQGHHGDNGVKNADIILPSASYTEKNATYVNLEGRPQRAYQAVRPPGEAKEDWVIINDIANEIHQKLPYANLYDLRENMEKNFPHLALTDQIITGEVKNIKNPDKVTSKLIKKTDFNYYMTDPISRNSLTMAKCIKAQI